MLFQAGHKVKLSSQSLPTSADDSPSQSSPHQLTAPTAFYANLKLANLIQGALFQLLPLQAAATPAPPLHAESDLISVTAVVADARSVLYPVGVEVLLVEGSSLLLLHPP